MMFSGRLDRIVTIVTAGREDVTGEHALCQSAGFFCDRGKCHQDVYWNLDELQINGLDHAHFRPVWFARVVDRLVVHSMRGHVFRQEALS